MTGWLLYLLFAGIPINTHIAAIVAAHLAGEAVFAAVLPFVSGVQIGFINSSFKPGYRNKCHICIQLNCFIIYLICSSFTTGE